MEDIGGIIFYIIAAVIGIITSVGSKKKKAAKAAAEKARIDKEVYGDPFETREDPMVAEETPVNFETIFEEDIFDNYKTDYEPVEEESPKIFNPVMEGQYENPLAAEHKNEGIGVTEADPFNESEREIVENEIGRDEKILEEFDLKKAVIYSEILKRKYY